MEEIEHTINTTTKMVVDISEKRCGCYTDHSCQDEYKMKAKLPIYNKHEGDNPKFQNITLEDESS